MALGKDKETQQQAALEDLEWPSQPADSGGDTATDPAQDEPAAEPTRPTAAVTALADGRTEVDLSNYNRAYVAAGDRAAWGKDTDDDGLRDAFELQNGMDPKSKDSDGDGLEDAFELDHDLNPTSADTDGDGFSDGVEFERGYDAATTWSPPNATDDDVDGDGIPNLTEIRYGTSPSVDGHKAGGLGSDAVEGMKHYYDGHKTGDAIGDAWLRNETGVAATPEEQAALDDAIFDSTIGSSDPTHNARGIDALNNFQDTPETRVANERANAYLAQQMNDAAAAAISTGNLPQGLGVARGDQLLGGGILTPQNATGVQNLVNQALAGQLGGLDLDGPNVGPGTGGTGVGNAPGTGAGTGLGGNSTSATSGGTGSGSNTHATEPRDPGMGRDGFGDTGDLGGSDEPMKGDPTGGGGAPATAPPAAPRNAWDDALDALQPSSNDDSSGLSGPRGGDGGGSAPDSPSLPAMDVGAATDAFNAASNQPPKAASTHNDGVVDDVDFSASEIPAGNTQSWPYITGQPVSDTSSDGTNTNAGTTDDDSVPYDDSSDDPDAGADDPAGTADDGETATAFRDPDADGFVIAVRAPIAGGGYTDGGGGRGDLSGVDLSAAVVHHRGDLTPIAHTDADAGDVGGLVDVPIAGGGYTDGIGRGDLPTIDLTGITPMDPSAPVDLVGYDGGIEAGDQGVGGVGDGYGGPPPGTDGSASMDPGGDADLGGAPGDPFP